MTQLAAYDAVIIGAGQAGVPLSQALARAGWKTALIERVHVGGTCVNEGCSPTKTMVASARVAYLARRGADYGVQTGPVQVDMTVVRQRKRDIVNSFRSGNERRIESTDGVDLLMGEAHLTGRQTVEVLLNSGEKRQLTARTIFLNGGARPARPAINGLNHVPALDSTSIMELDTVPEHLLVMGGGYIGLEFGQMFRRFGSQVTIIQRGAHLLPHEDEDVTAEVADILRQDGIEILLQSSPISVERLDDGRVQMVIHTPQGSRIVTGSHLLLATGRVPDTENLHLEAADVQMDQHGFIQVNDRLETSAPGIYALGDIKGGPAFTHISYDDFRIIRTNLLEGGNATIQHRLVPYTVFIDPQLGRIGLSEREARAQGYSVRVAKMPMTSVARALEVAETRGFMKAVVDAETQRILGAAILGIEGGETMALLQVAMMGNLPYTTLRDAIFAHPTLAESLNNLFASFEQE